MAALPVPPFPLGQGSGAIVSIDLHVVIGQVAAIGLGTAAARMKFHIDVDFILRKNPLRLVLAECNPSAAAGITLPR